MKKILFTLMAVLVLTACNINNPEQPTKTYFSLWNDCEALTVLKTYVEDVTNPQSANFIPEADRIATFDMDGTFVGELYPSYFEYNLLEYRALEDTSYTAPAEVHSGGGPRRSL